MQILAVGGFFLLMGTASIRYLHHIGKNSLLHKAFDSLHNAASTVSIYADEDALLVLVAPMISKCVANPVPMERGFFYLLNSRFFCIIKGR